MTLLLLLGLQVVPSVWLIVLVSGCLWLDCPMSSSQSASEEQGIRRPPENPSLPTASWLVFAGIMSSVSFWCNALVFSAFLTGLFPFPAGLQSAEHSEELHRNAQALIARQSRNQVRHLVCHLHLVR